MFLMINGTHTTSTAGDRGPRARPHARARALVRRLRAVQGRRAVAAADQPGADHAPVQRGRPRPQALEADDRAALSELYPEPSFATSTGTIAGTVLRCGTGAAVSGANVRAINVNDPTIQLTRMTGFDGTTGRQLRDQGRPAGRLRIVVEPLSGDEDFSTAWRRSPASTPTSRRSSSTRPRRATAPRTPTPTTGEHRRSARAERCPSRSSRSQGASLALVVDVTGSMGPEIGAIKTGLRRHDHGALRPRRAASPRRRSSRSTTRRRSDASAMIPRGCAGHRRAHHPQHARLPGGLQPALMTAGRLLGSGGRALLSPTPTAIRPDRRGRRRGAVRVEGRALPRCSPASCPPAPAAAAAGRAPRPPCRVDPRAVRRRERTPTRRSRPPPRRREPGADLLRGEPLLRRPVQLPARVKSRARPMRTTRYANTLANLGISAVRAGGRRGRPGRGAPRHRARRRADRLQHRLPRRERVRRRRTAAWRSTACRVLSPTRLIVRLTVAADAELSFRDVTVTRRPRRRYQRDRDRDRRPPGGRAPAGATILSVTPSTGAAGTSARRAHLRRPHPLRRRQRRELRPRRDRERC